MNFPRRSLFPAPDKIPVNSLFQHQFVMLSTLYNLSSVNHQNLVGILHGLQPMSNHDDGFLFRQCLDCPHKLLLIFRVNICGRLIQNNDRESFIMALAMEIRCFSPPERDAPPSPMIVS